MQDLNIHHDWSLQKISKLFKLPLITAIYRAAAIHQQYFVPNTIQVGSLLSIKTGLCPEDCAYCAQSVHHHSKLVSHDLLDLAVVVNKAKLAKSAGVSRFCMVASGRSASITQFTQILAMIKAVKKIGLETCMSLGSLTIKQAQELKAAGLDYYNHNLNTSPKYYKKIVTTHQYTDRINTLKNLRNVGIKICCGGIVGMGEKNSDRISLLQQLANFPEHPHSIPINYFVPIDGTPLEIITKIDPFEFVRTIAVARILMPRSLIRLAAGRNLMNDELQALCFCAGANSIFCGEKLLTTKNPTIAKDRILLKRLGIKPIHPMGR